MDRIISEKIARIIKNKKKLEKELQIKISNRGKEVEIEGEIENEILAIKIIEALEFGFPYKVAMSLKEGEYTFEKINIKDYTIKKDFERIRARIIGKDGKALKTLSLLTDCSLELKGNEVGIIGEPEEIKYAIEGLIGIIRGSKHGNVYKGLEKRDRAPIHDFGIKEPKKKTKNFK